jgi:predicted nucleic acid-binding Zn ribbon protein
MNRELLYRNLRQKRTKPLGEAIQEFMKKSMLQDRFIESYVQLEWKNIVGEVVAKYTDSVYLKNDRLILKISSAPLRNELLMNKKQLLSNVCKHLNTNVIREIIFV